LARNRANIAVAMSTPTTRTPAAAIGTANRPVPIPSSSNDGCTAISRSVSTIPAIAASCAADGSARVAS
jgi:hypothetical protein